MTKMQIWTTPKKQNKDHPSFPPLQPCLPPHPPTPLQRQKQAKAKQWSFFVKLASAQPQPTQPSRVVSEQTPFASQARPFDTVKHTGYKRVGLPLPPPVILG